MTSRIERHTETVSKVLEAGEGSKAFIKTGMEALSYLYEIEREDFNNKTNFENCWEIPYSLAHIRTEKHQTIFGDHWTRIAELAEMRTTIKSFPIITRPTKEEGVEQKIRRTILEEIKARKENFDIAKRIVELFGEFTKDSHGREIVLLPLHCEYVYCTNYFGTSWIRIDWYLRGKKTAFQLIMGAVDEVRREKKL